MPDSTKMAFQTPFWSGTTTGGRDVYAPHPEHVTHGQIDRWVLPRFDSGEGGWPGTYHQPASPDPELLKMGFQQTGIYGGPGGRGEVYRGPQTPPIGVPVGWGVGGLGRARMPRRGAARWAAMRMARQARRIAELPTPQPDLGDVSGGTAFAMLVGVFVVGSWLFGRFAKSAQRAYPRR